MMARTNFLNGMVSYIDYAEQEYISDIREDKVVDIRNKIRSVKYDINEHLDVVVDRILENILTQQPEN